MVSRSKVVVKSKNKFNAFKIALVGLILGEIFVAAPGAFALNLNDLNKQLNDTQQQLDQTEQAKRKDEKQAGQLTINIKNLNRDVNSLSQKITDTQIQIDQTQNDIKLATDSIAQRENELTIKLGNQAESLRNIYVASAQDPLLLLAGHGNISQAINQSTYLETLEIQIEANINEVTKIRNDLIDQKNNLTQKQQQLSQLQNDQVVNKKSLEWQVGQKNQMLGMTLAQIDTYENTIKNLNLQISNISAQIYAARQKLRGKEIRLNASSGYPYTLEDAQAMVVDYWYFYAGQCTSYVAWYWNVVLNKNWVNTGPGNARDWSILAKDQGYSVSNTPRVNAILVLKGPLYPGDNYGHVAVVRAVNSDGTIDISEMNWFGLAVESYRKNVDPSDYGSYSYIY